MKIIAHPLKAFGDWIDNAPDRWVALAAYILLYAVGWSDYKVGYQLSISLFYLIPISIITWGAGFKNGLVMVVVSTICWFLADRFSGHVHAHEAIPYWNALMRGGFARPVSAG